MPIGVAVLTSFGVAFGWILHRAVEQAVYKITGIRALDSYLLSWLFGLFVAFSPAVLYLAFGSNEFADTPDGVKLLQRLHRAGQALLAALVIQYSPISPMKALFWSTVINGVVAVPLMVVIILLVSKKSVMGAFTAPRSTIILGWIATAVMGAAAVRMFIPG